MLILGIDPGNIESAFCFVGSGYKIDSTNKIGNDALLAMLSVCTSKDVAAVVVESMTYYGKRVGKEVFDTAYIIGRIQQMCEDRKIPCFLYAKNKWGQGLLRDNIINDSAIRRAILDRFGADILSRLKLKDGKSDLRSAYALAVFHLDQTMSGRAVHA